MLNILNVDTLRQCERIDQTFIVGLRSIVGDLAEYKIFVIDRQDSGATRIFKAVSLVKSTDLDFELTIAHNRPVSLYIGDSGLMRLRDGTWVNGDQTIPSPDLGDFPMSVVENIWTIASLHFGN